MDCEHTIALRPWFTKLLTPLVDGLTVLAYVMLVPVLAVSFTKPSVLNGVIFLFAYACLIAGTRLIRMLGHSMEGGANPKKAADWTGCGGFLAFCFGISTAVAALTVAGIMENSGFGQVTNLDNAYGAVLRWVFSLLILAFVVVYPFVLILPAKTCFSANNPAKPLIHLLAVSMVNVMVLVSVAFWESMFKSEEPAGMSLGFRIFALVMFLILFALFQAPPRILLFLLERNIYGLVTFLITLCFYLWPLTG